ncbi:MAG: SGNH/GDSL hydrolase family protein [Lachnospiraceae bacterium]|nr:SGNH/GDSL hydrolase family protein [Lachnospiraceae bacterium]
MKTILFQGDSITDAGRSRENDANTGVGYPTLVKGELTFEYSNHYIVYNRGISGNRVVDLYARIKEDIINLQPDVISILIGVNDVWHEINYRQGVEAEKYFKVYSMLIEEIKEALPNVKIMILEPFVLKGVNTEDTADCPDKWNLFRAEVKKRAAKAKEIAEKYGLIFVPLQDKFDEVSQASPDNYWLRDGVHPTTAGHELIKREWLKAFKKI